jgi:hypothetical protein
MKSRRSGPLSGKNTMAMHQIYFVQVNVTTWGSFTRRSECSHHGSTSVPLMDLTTSSVKFDLSIAGMIPSQWMEAPLPEMKVRVSGICKSMCCRLAVPTRIITAFCYRWSQTIHHYRQGYSPSFPPSYPKMSPRVGQNFKSEVHPKSQIQPELSRSTALWGTTLTQMKRAHMTY